MIQLTGTFLDEVTHDIAPHNWGPAEWARDFDAMRAVGIDTVVLIRCGYRRRATFESAVLRERMGTYPVYLDLVDLFLRQAERCGMAFYFGTYDSGTFWTAGRYQEEADLNKALADEVVERYGDRPAFRGWYISHEIDAYDEGVMTVYEDLAAHLRGLKDQPIFISPYIRGVKQFGDAALSLGEHVRSWADVFARLDGLVDVVAFQDGNVSLGDLPEFLAENRRLAAAHGLTSWSNVESFSRDVPIKFPPIDHRVLRYKMEAAAAAGVDKLITFEFSHFLSPHSVYPAARNLYLRQVEFLESQGFDGADARALHAAAR
ncbi:DUF4434 domain-containing protein [Rubrivirga sp.]|uniref:DUF4434 domain-containing protein n=1 Tax=Rubrivirga sp. TaxID=1885344 RepID=UPI003B516EEE